MVGLWKLSSASMIQASGVEHISNCKMDVGELYGYKPMVWWTNESRVYCNKPTYTLQTITYAKISPELVNPKDIAGNAEEGDIAGNAEEGEVSFFCVPSYIFGVHQFGWDFCICDRFFNPTRGSHIPSSWMVHAGCVFVAGIHPSKTWMSGSLESMRWNVSVHRLGLGFYSHPKEFWGNGVRNHPNSKGKIPSTGGSDKVQTRNAASCRTASSTLLTELLQPH